MWNWLLDILDLPGWEVTDPKLVETGYEITAVCADQPEGCPKCGVIGRFYKHGTKLTRFRDSPIRGHQVMIVAKVQRFKCRESGCGETFLQPLGGIAEGRWMTERCAEYIRRQCLIDTFIRIAQHVGCDSKTVRTIANEYINQLNNDYLPQLPAWLGIDETEIDGKMRCVITDVVNRRPIEMLALRDRDTLGRWFHRFRDKSMVKGVAIDMWRPYRDLANAMFPGAPVVIDKFHVLRMANFCMERVRVRLGKTKTQGLRRHGVRNRVVLNKRPAGLSEQQRFTRDAWLDNEPEMAAAYELKEAFYAIYSLPKAEAVEAFDAFPATVPAEIKVEFGPLLRIIKNWRTEILAYFDHPISNGYTEALNGVAKQINRAGRGYSFEVLRARILFRSGGIVGTGPKIRGYTPLPRWLQSPIPFKTCHSCLGRYLMPVVRKAAMKPLVKRQRTITCDMCEDCRERFGWPVDRANSEVLGWR